MEVFGTGPRTRKCFALVEEGAHGGYASPYLVSPQSEREKTEFPPPTVVFALEPPLRTCTTEILSLVAEWRVGIRCDGAGHGTFSAWLRGSGNHGNTLDGVVPRGSVTHLYVLLLLRRLSLGTQVLVSFFVTFCLRFCFLFSVRF